MRPQDALAQIVRRYPQAWKNLDIMRRDRGRDLPDWPEWCLLPMAGWYVVVCQQHGVQRLTPEIAPDIALLSTLGAWRLTQGVYRFAPGLHGALAQTALEGDIPASALLRLPEWCIYVEEPPESGYEGFWAHCEHDANTGRTELRLLFNAGDRLIPHILHIGQWPLAEAVERALMEARRQAEIVGMELPLVQRADVAAQADMLARPINLLLYLCSEEPEVRDPREPQRVPRRSLPRREGGNGWQFPAGPHIWEVGREIGARLRESSRGWQEDGRSSPRPHIRRAHWHGFWRGTGEAREFFHKWLPPLFVAGE